MSLFEIIMLIAFGAAWPFSVYRSYVSRSTKGKSISFLYIVIVGYLAGIMHKVLHSFDGVIWFYFLNLLLVSADVLIYYRNRKIEKDSQRLSL